MSPRTLTPYEKSRLPPGYRATFTRAEELANQAASSLRHEADTAALAAVEAALEAVVAACQAAVVRQDSTHPAITPIRAAKAWRASDEGPSVS